MKISVTTICYNSEASISRTIESFLKQDHRDKELIVVDGASKDRTCEIVRSYQSPEIMLKSEPDAGIYDALNKATRLASGEVIGLLHSNDLYADNKVLSRVAAAFQDPGLDAVFADVSFFAPENVHCVVRRYRSDMFRPAMLAYGLMPAHTTLHLRRSVFDRFGYYKTDYRIAGDFEFVARIFKDDLLSYRYFNEVWTLMETGGASTSGFQSKVRLNREVLRACQDLGIKTNMFWLLSKYPRKLLELVWRR